MSKSLYYLSNFFYFSEAKKLSESTNEIKKNRCATIYYQH